MVCIYFFLLIIYSWKYVLPFWVITGIWLFWVNYLASSIYYRFKCSQCTIATQNPFLEWCNIFIYIQGQLFGITNICDRWYCSLIIKSCMTFEKQTSLKNLHTIHYILRTKHTNSMGWNPKSSFESAQILMNGAYSFYWTTQCSIRVV